MTHLLALLSCQFCPVAILTWIRRFKSKANKQTHKDLSLLIIREEVFFDSWRLNYFITIIQTDSFTVAAELFVKGNVKKMISKVDWR